MNQTIHNLLTEQLASWETARNNYAALSGVQVKELNVNGTLYKVQFNPARIVSSGAKVDAKSIKERKCFLCPANLPAVQKGIPFEGHYNILVNPFPIFPRHLTVPETAHVAQRIAPRFGDMLDLARQLTDYTIFYNGPKCGASAPDHAHFQACYTAEGDANLLSSPASVDLGGVFITPVEKDFIKITAEDIAQILGEVCLSPADFQKVRKRIQEQL